MDSRGRRFFFLLLISVAIGSYLLSRWVPVEILRLPSLTITVVSVFFIGYLLFPESLELGKLSSNRANLADSLIFVIISAIVVIGRISESGVHDVYYVIAILTSGLLAFRVLTPPIRTRIHIAQIVLFAIAIRATMWFSYPVYGMDKFHFAEVGYLVSTGEIVPETVTYYANFPQAHVFAGAYTMISGVPLKSGHFSLGIALSLSIIAVYLLAKYVVRSDQAGLLAMLFVAIGSYHIRSGGEPFAQALFTALSPVIFYLLFSHTDRPKRAILLGLAIFGATVQNIAPLVLTGVCVVFWLGNRIGRSVGSIGGFNFRSRISINTNIVFAFAIAGVYYYNIAGYFRFQTMRVFGIFLSFFEPDQGSEAVREASFGAPPNVELFGHDLPGLLMWAAPLLVLGGLLVLTVYVLGYGRVRGENDGTPLQYIIVTGSVFAVFAVIFVARSGGVTRALPYLIILLAPVFGWLGVSVSFDRKIAGKCLIVLFAICIASAGILTPIVAKPALSDDEFKPYLDTNQVAAVEFSAEHTEGATSSAYVAGYERIWRVTQGYAPPEMIVQGSSRESTKSVTKLSEAPDLVIRGVLSDNDPSAVDEYKAQSQNGTTTIYFEYYETAYGIHPPGTNRIYSSGSTQIYS